MKQEAKTVPSGPVRMALILALALVLAPALAGIAGRAEADELAEVAFTEGTVALKAGDLDTAVDRFEEATRRDPGDAVAWYWLGVAHARLDEKEPALEAFDRALALEPDFAEAAYARGNVLSSQGEDRKARSAWERAAALVPGTQLADRAREHIDAPRPPSPAGRKWYADAGMGVEYDTNVFLYPNQGDAPIVGGFAGKRYRPSDPLADTRFVFYVDGGYRLYGNDRWSISAHQAFESGVQTRSEDVNYVQYQPALWVTYDADPMTFALKYTFTYFAYGGDTLFLRHEVEPSVTLREGSRSYTRLSYRYTHNDYRDNVASVFDASGNDHRVAVDQYLVMFDRRGYGRVGVEFRRDLTDGSEYSGSYTTLSGELMAPVPGDANLRLEAAQSWGDFDNDSAFSRPNTVYYVMGPTFNRSIVPVRTGDPKREILTTVGATLSREFGDHWSASARYIYAVNQSSIDAFDYNRNIFSLFANYRF